MPSRQHHTGGFLGSASLAVFDVIAVIGGYGVFRRKSWAFPLLCADCVLGCLWGALYAFCLILGLAQQYTDWLYGITRARVWVRLFGHPNALGSSPGHTSGGGAEWQLTTAASGPRDSALFATYASGAGPLLRSVAHSSTRSGARLYYSAYVLPKDGEFTSELVAAFAGYKPPVTASIKVVTGKGEARDKATGKRVKLWSGKVTEIPWGQGSPLMSPGTLRHWGLGRRDTLQLRTARTANGLWNPKKWIGCRERPIGSAGGLPLPPPTPPDMRVRVRRFLTVLADRAALFLCHDDRCPVAQPSASTLQDQDHRWSCLPAKFSPSRVVRPSGCFSPARCSRYYGLC